jgi:uncharacterized protein (UPF0333 family)
MNILNTTKNIATAKLCNNSLVITNSNNQTPNNQSNQNTHTLTIGKVTPIPRNCFI